MMADVTVEAREINIEKLDADLRAALPARVSGLSLGGGKLRVHLVDEASDADQATVATLVAAHDPDVLTATQLERAEAEADRAAVRAEKVGAALDQIEADLAALADTNTTAAERWQIVARALQRQALLIRAVRRLV